MGVWDTTTPAGSDLISLGDDKIREMKVALQESLRGQNTEGVESVFPGSFPSTAPVFRYRGIKDTTGNRPASGQYGLFFDETRNVLQRDNGSTWDDVGIAIPAGTVMVFYQASAPTGWTAVAVNDKFLRVVTAGGTGGTTGGTVAASTSLAHTHTLAHTHDMQDHTHTLSHTHVMATDSNQNGTISTSGVGYVTADGPTSELMNVGLVSGSTPVTIVQATTAANGSDATTGPSNNTSEAASSETTSETFGGAFAYADVVIASKD